LKIYASDYLYPNNNYYLTSISQFNEENERLKLAAKNNITPNIEDSYIMLYYNNTDEYNKGLNYNKVLLTEYIEGINCEEYMKTNKFIESDIDKIKTLMKKLHSIGIFHGSIKPSNIIFNKNYKKTNTYKFLFVDFSYSDTCQTISKSKLNSNIKAIEELSVKYSDRDYIKVYIAIYYLLKNKSINIIM
jgi:serine/threonine protein kinase